MNFRYTGLTRISFWSIALASEKSNFKKYQPLTKPNSARFDEQCWIVDRLFSLYSPAKIDFHQYKIINGFSQMYTVCVYVWIVMWVYRDPTFNPS